MRGRRVSVRILGFAAVCVWALVSVLSRQLTTTKWSRWWRIKKRVVAARSFPTRQEQQHSRVIILQTVARFLSCTLVLTKFNSCRLVCWTAVVFQSADFLIPKTLFYYLCLYFRAAQNGDQHDSVHPHFLSKFVARERVRIPWAKVRRMYRIISQVLRPSKPRAWILVAW